MGQVVSILSELKCGKICDNCSKYILNSMECDSKCSECCEIHFQTNEIEISDDDSDTELEIGGCCLYRHNYLNQSKNK